MWNKKLFFFVLLGHLILNALHPTYTPVSINCGAKGNGKKKWGVVMNNLRQESVTCVVYLYQHIGFILNWSHMLNKREIGFQLYCFCHVARYAAVCLNSHDQEERMQYFSSVLLFTYLFLKRGCSKF